MSTLWNFVLDVLFPPLCFGCRRWHRQFLCGRCYSTIAIHNSLYCPVCQNRLPENKKICHRGSPYLLAPATDYRHEPVQELIHQLKYNGLTSALQPIAKILNEYLAASKIDSNHFVIIPLPLSRQRFRQRGFNQAELIARIAAEKLGLPMTADALTKTKDAPKQSEAKSWDQRQANVAGCFAVSRPEAVAGKNILLVDDVFTSGATIGEAVRILKSAGARKIIALVVARAR